MTYILQTCYNVLGQNQKQSYWCKQKYDSGTLSHSFPELLWLYYDADFVAVLVPPGMLHNVEQAIVCKLNHKICHIITWLWGYF